MSDIRPIDLDVVAGTCAEMAREIEQLRVQHDKALGILNEFGFGYDNTGASVGLVEAATRAVKAYEAADADSDFYKKKFMRHAAPGRVLEAERQAAREQMAAEDPGWWSDMGGKGLIPVRGHFFRLAKIGQDRIELLYEKPCKKNRK